jgi:hypothetical protein
VDILVTPKGLRAAIVDTRAQFQAALHGAHHNWDKSPAGGEGEESWSPRKVAEHFIGTDWHFTNSISQACGAPALERPSIDVSSPAAAAASATLVAATNDNILRHVSDGDLSKTWMGPLGKRTVEELLTIMASHGHDHVNQIKAAS